MAWQNWRHRRPTLTPVLRPPQVGTALSVSDHRTAAGHDFGLVRAHATGHYTVVLLGGDGELAAWEQLLGGAESIDVGEGAGDVVALHAVLDTYPITAAAHREWVFADRRPQVEATEVAVRAHLAVTFAALTKATRTEPEEMAVEIGRRLPTLLGSLSAAGIDVVPATSGHIAAFVAEAYRETDTDDDITDIADAGPADITHRVRDVFCHDGFQSTSWVISPHVLDTGLAAHVLAVREELQRVRLMVSYRRIRLADTVAEDDPIRVTFTPALRRFGAVVTITEPLHRSPRIDALRSRLPLSARLGVRSGYDRNAELFAAGLGVGVLLPEHSLIDDEPIKHRHRRASDPSALDGEQHPPVTATVSAIGQGAHL